MTALVEYIGWEVVKKFGDDKGFNFDEGVSIYKGYWDSFLELLN